MKQSLKQKAEKILRDISALLIAMKKKQTPWYAKAVAGVTVAYALSPIDLIPDFIPVLGYLDDIIILPLLVLLTVKLIPKDVMEQCREQAQGMWKDGKPKKWYYAVPVIIVWCAIITAILLSVLRQRER